MRVAIVTPSWAPDYELCRILVESVRRYLPEDIPHYLLVAREDLVLFQSLASERTIVLRTDAAVGGFYRLPFSRKWHVALDSPPVRGWIHQQLLKLSLADLLDAEVYVLVDSDCFYVRPFDPRSVFIDGKIPLAREEKEWFANDPETQHWHRIAAKLLGLPLAKAPYATGYVGQHRFWRRDVLCKLQEHLNKGGGRRTWIRKIARQLTFSEYVLYGMFCEHLLGLDTSGHYIDDRRYDAGYYGERPLSRTELCDLRSSVGTDKFMVMISAKSGTPVDLIRNAFSLPSPAAVR